MIFCNRCSSPVNILGHDVATLLPPCTCKPSLGMNNRLGWYVQIVVRLSDAAMCAAEGCDYRLIRAGWYDHETRALCCSSGCAARLSEQLKTHYDSQNRE